MLDARGAKAPPCSITWLLDTRTSASAPGAKDRNPWSSSPLNYILSPCSSRARGSGAKALGAEGCDHGAQAPAELKPEPPGTEAAFR